MTKAPGASRAAGPRMAAPSQAAVWAIAFALVVLVAATYAPVRGFEYVELDDPIYVTENPHVRDGLTLAGIRWALTTSTATNWHPLTWMSHMVDVSFFGMEPGPHHVVNVVLHGISTLLLFLLLTSLTASPWRSGFVAAVFAVHPLHVESVAWIAERKDVLSACLWMLTLVAYVGYVRRPSRLRLAGVAAVFALGLMAKPMVVTLPFVMLLLDLWPLKRWSWSRWAGLIPLVKEKLPLFVLAAASSLVTIVAQGSGGAVAGLDVVPLGLRLGNAVVSTAGYLLKMVWPVRLSVLYPLPDHVAASDVALALLVLGVVTAVVWRAAATRPWLVVGWFWYLGTLVPVSGLVQVGMQAMADRYTYLPMIGISIMVAWLPGPSVTRTAVGRLAVGVAVLGLVGAMAATTAAQLPVWRNNVTLFTWATMQTLGVDEFAAHVSLGATLLKEQRFDEARAHYREANRLQPGSADATYGLGLTYLHAGRAAESISPLVDAVTLAPDDPDRRNDLAVAYVRANRIDDAIREYRRLTELRPDEPRFSQALSALLSRKQTAP